MIGSVNSKFSSISLMNNDAVIAGQAVYSKRVLSLYDFWVLGVSNHFFWKCPTRLISEKFKSCVSDNHLDVGVGTGYYLKKHLPKNTRRIALLDLNSNSLASTANAIKWFNPESYCANVFEPLSLDCERFDSISVNYLLHCLPGNMKDKASVFGNLKALLFDGGSLFGSTILGSGVPHNVLGNKLMHFYNKKGIFTNLDDNIEELREALNTHFSNVEIELHGCVAIFSAKKVK